MAENKFIYAVGRRKSASARVRIFKGKGINLVNGKPANEFFALIKLQSEFLKPFKVTNLTDKFYFTAKVAGGGTASQCEALTLGISRGLAESEKDNFKSLLRKHGLLTRDPRVRQRRMVGMGGKSRRKKQSPKR